MRITSIQTELIHEIPFLNAGSGPGGFYRDLLPVQHGLVDQLPEGVVAIIVTADLQGRETFESSAGRPLRLLGEVVPTLLIQEVLPSLTLGDGRIGVVLAGDFYTVPALDKRGGTGDVSLVWHAFADQFDWVIGVAGNHDLFGETATRPKFSKSMRFLDGDSIIVENVRVGGLSGIVGNPRRPWRRTDDEFVDSLGMLLCDRPEMVVMHDGPDVPSSGRRGSPRIREALERFESTLVVRGHAHWDEPLAELANGTQVLNVDARVVVLTSETA